MWTRFILATLAIPSLIPFLTGLSPRIGGISKRSHFRGVLSDLTLGLEQIALTVILLAYQAWLMADAILRTLARIFVTRKNLLQWITAAQAKSAVDLDIFGIYRRMFASVALALAALLTVISVRHTSLPAAIPFVAMWIAAPAVARWISLPPTLPEIETLSPKDAKTLRLNSRSTWRFFEEFVTPEENFLPPDNFQEDPKPVVAHRTSPTNIGLYLLTTLAARDFGWIGTTGMVERLEATFQTMNKLEQFRGHFYNWYDTRDLHPLDPKYVSSVDSGNIAGHLLALGNGCRELIQKSSVEISLLAGVEDALLLLREALARVTDIRRTHTVTRKQLANAIDAASTLCVLPPTDTADWAVRFVELKDRVQTVADIAQTLDQELGTAPNSELRYYAESAQACVESNFQDARILIPWLRLDSEVITEMAERPAAAGSRMGSH